MAQPAGFGKVFEVGPAFRADPSFTSRHATEFTSVDAEISWIDSHEDVMKMHEELLVAGFTAVKDKHGAEIEALVRRRGDRSRRMPFPRIPLAEAKEIVAERGYEVPRADDDMDPEGERQIVRVRAREVRPRVRVPHRLRLEHPAVLPHASRGRPEPHQQLRPASSTASRSPPAPSASTASTCSIAQAKDKGLDPEELEFYLDFFRYGVPPHGGFGMGLARVLMLMLHQPSIREVTYLFRGPNRLAP